MIQRHLDEQEHIWNTHLEHHRTGQHIIFNGGTIGQIASSQWHFRSCQTLSMEHTQVPKIFTVVGHLPCGHQPPKAKIPTKHINPV